MYAPTHTYIQNRKIVFIAGEKSARRLINPVQYTKHICRLYIRDREIQESTNVTRIARRGKDVRGI